MLKNYTTIALRNLRRHGGYAFINITGLAVGMACCLLIVLYVQDELRYDTFHERADRIYRVVASTNEDGQPTNANGGFLVGPTLESDFSEIERAVRFRKMGWGEKRVIARGDLRFYESRFFFADSAVFDVFTFPFKAGEPQGALAAPHTVVITEQMADKYFPGEEALGQALQIDPYNDGRFTDYTVTGVLQNLPAQSHIQFDFLASFVSQENAGGWGFWEIFTYVLLRPGADASALAARFDDFQHRHWRPDPWYTLDLQPLLDIRLHSHLRAELQPNGDIAYVYLFSAIALFILLIACINFMNLATARSARRAREVGMRKVMGAYRAQLIGQFLGEALLLSGMAVVFALLLSAVLLPIFNDIAGKTMLLSTFGNMTLLGGLVVLALLVGVVAGSYPAFYLSAFRPAAVLKSGSIGLGRGATALRKSLVVFQFAVSILLIACTATVAEQMDYIRNKNLGFEREQVVVLPLNDELRSRYETAKSEGLRHPGIQAMTLTEQVPGRAGNGSGYRWEGQEEWEGFTRFFADPDFVETYGVELIAGRDLSFESPADTAEGFLVNESFVEAAGWSTPTEAVGQVLEMMHSGAERPGHIVGVVKDFHLFSLRNGMAAAVINPMPLHKFNFVSVRFTAEQARPALAHLEGLWKTFSPSYPFDHYFVDDDFARLHQADARLGRVFRSFAMLAILVACLGLFGLAAFTAEQRTREIGVRKVMGASVSNILVLLSKDFTRLVFIAFVLATPLAYYAMSRWLEAFSFRIDLSVWTFLAAGLTALLIAWLTVGYQSLKAALTDPVKALRYE